MKSQYKQPRSVAKLGRDFELGAVAFLPRRGTEVAKLRLADACDVEAALGPLDEVVAAVAARPALLRVQLVCHLSEQALLFLCAGPTVRHAVSLLLARAACIDCTAILRAVHRRGCK